MTMQWSSNMQLAKAKCRTLVIIWRSLWNQVAVGQRGKWSIWGVNNGLLWQAPSNWGSHWCEPNQTWGNTSQEQQGVKRSVAFASCSLSEVERWYSQVEKEGLAVVWGCERFNLYLSGLESFQLVTDCKALEATYGPKSKQSARVQRWVLCLMPFKYSAGQN